MLTTVFVPPSDNMRHRMNVIEALPPDSIALFKIGSFYEAFGKHAQRIHEVFRTLKREPFGQLVKREGVPATCASVFMIHTLIAILQTEGVTRIYVAEDGLNLQTVRAWLAE
jgi:hypothetical protein